MEHVTSGCTLHQGNSPGARGKGSTTQSPFPSCIKGKQWVFEVRAGTQEHVSYSAVSVVLVTTR